MSIEPARSEQVAHRLALLTRFWSTALPGGRITGLLLPVTHRASARLVLGLVVLAIRAFPGANAGRGIAALRPATEITR